MFFGVPTMYNRLVALPRSVFEAHDLRRMRLWVSGSAPLNAVTFERFRERTGYSLMDRYGMTECGFVLSTPLTEARRPGVVGRPLPGIEVRLVDADKADAGKLVEVAAGIEGEIVIRGPNLFSGYWNRPNDTQRAFVDGYLRSGDLARREPDGEFHIVGRRSVDIIKTRGFKVGAVEIEEVLQRCPGVQEVAVVGVAGFPATRRSSRLPGSRRMNRTRGQPGGLGNTVERCSVSNGSQDGGVTASTEMDAARRHTGVHAPVIVCKTIIANNQQLAYAA